jgi:hypothetical protein
MRATPEIAPTKFFLAEILKAVRSKPLEVCSKTMFRFLEVKIGSDGKHPPFADSILNDIPSLLIQLDVKLLDCYHATSRG